MLRIIAKLWLLCAFPAMGLHRKNMKKWPGGIVYFDIDPYLTKDMREAVRYASDYMNTFSCVRWVQRLPWENISDYVSFTLEDDERRRPRCAAEVEYRGGRQRLRVGRWCFRAREGWQQRQVMVHEMMHVLGFHHEHQRPDRDCYISVGPPQDSHPAYVRLSPGDEFVDDFPYDYSSMMHYWGKPHSNMVARNKSITKLGRYNDVLSLSDKRKVRSVYCGYRSYCEVAKNVDWCQQQWDLKQQTNCTTWTGWLHPLNEIP